MFLSCLSCREPFGGDAWILVRLTSPVYNFSPGGIWRETAVIAGYQVLCFAVFKLVELYWTNNTVVSVCVKMRFSQFNSSLNFQSVDQVRHSSHASHLISSSPLLFPFSLSRINSKSSEKNRSTFIFLSSLLHFNVCSCDIFSLNQSGICLKGSCSSIKIISTVCSHHRFVPGRPLT